MYRWENWKFYKTTSGITSACGEEVAIIEDFYPNRDIRVYKNYVPCLRSERSGLKVVYYVDK